VPMAGTGSSIWGEAAGVGAGSTEATIGSSSVAGSGSACSRLRRQMRVVTGTLAVCVERVPVREGVLLAGPQREDLAVQAAGLMQAEEQGLLVRVE
jgi:hypothetical protein